MTSTSEHTVHHAVPREMIAWFTSGDGIDQLQRRRVEVPALGDHDLLVKVAARALNYRDLLVVEGTGHWRPARPVVPLSDGVGHVVARGPAVTRFTTGDRVSAMFLPKWQTGPLLARDYVDPVGGPANRGMLADYVAVHEDEAALTPGTLTDAEAATLPVAALTAWHAVNRAAVRPGETVLAHGTGAVALFALQFAHAKGARVAITSSSDTKLEGARRLGAELTINRGSQDVVAAVSDWTAADGVANVIETIGGANLNLSLRAAAIGADISFVGLIDGLAAQINAYEFVTKSVTIHGIETGSRAMYEVMAAFIDDHGIRPVVDTISSTEAVAEQLHRLQRGDVFGKIVLV